MYTYFTVFHDLIWLPALALQLVISYISLVSIAAPGSLESIARTGTVH